MIHGRTRGALVTAIAIALVLAACSSTDPDDAGDTGGTPVTDGTLTVMVQGFGNERFDPQTMTGGAIYQYYLGNLTVQRNGEVFPSIAESWEPSADGLTWTFTIRDDVVFHNGEPLTVDDVVFSLRDTFSKEAIAAAINDTVTGIARVTESIEATGPNTVEVRHSRPLPFFAYFMTEYHGQMLPAAYFQEAGRDGFNEAPIGAGPLKFVDYRPGEELVFERFDDYFDKERIPQFKTLRYKLVPELATRVQALASGEADIISADLSVKSQIESSGNKVVFGPEASFIETMFPGCWKPELPCHDQRVRLALDLAIDKSLIMTELYGEAWTNAGFDFVSPSSIGYSDELAPRPADPEEARRLLAEAGYPGGQGFPTLIINTGEAPGIARLPDFALLLAQQWEEVLGISTDVRLGEIQSLKERRGAGEFDGQVFIRDNDARWDGGTFMTGRYGDPENDDHLTEDPELNAAVIAAQQAFLPEEQDRAYNEVYKKLRDAVYTINTGSLARIWGVSSRVSGWAPFSLQERMSPLETITLSE